MVITDSAKHEDKIWKMKEMEKDEDWCLEDRRGLKMKK